MVHKKASLENERVSANEINGETSQHIVLYSIQRNYVRRTRGH